jgi:threonine dehydrogenase-like Zn-dependent dehydrogenase
LAAAIEILEQIAVRPSERVLLLGAGRLGLLIAQVIQRTGCALDVAARHPRQIELLRKRQVRTISGEQIESEKYDLVIDATGSAQGFQAARRAVRPRGVIVLKSTFQGKMVVNMSSIVVDEISVIGSRCGPFPPAIRMLANHQVEVGDLIDARYSLHEGIAAFEKAGEPGVLKVLIEPG